jgi:hypothetical protein
MVLRHEVSLLKRQLHGSVRYRPADREILAGLSRVLPRWRWGCFLVTPETLLRWHWELSRSKWKRCGEPSEVQGARHFVMRSSSSSSDSAGRTNAGVVSAFKVSSAG